MSLYDIIFNIDFWQNVYLVSKWIFIVLSAFLTGGIILLLYKISSFRQKLDVGPAYKEYAKKPEPVESKPPVAAIASSKWQDIISKSESESEKEWKFAVIEADSLVDLVLKRSGYLGETMMERLKTVLPENLPSLNELWEAHKIRNQIAHNPEFTLTKKEAIRVLKIYKQVLQELKVL